MVNQGSTEPRTPGGRRAARYSSMQGELGVLSQKHVHLVFDHLHSDHQAFSADVADDLILVPEFCQFCHEMGADVLAVLLQLVLFDSLPRRRRVFVTMRSKWYIYPPPHSTKMEKNRWTNQQERFMLTSSTDEAMAPATGFPPKVLKWTALLKEAAISGKRESK